MVNPKAINLENAIQAGLPTERFPQTHQEAEIAEQKIAAKLESMSMEHHEKRLFEVHGIAATPEEDPQMVAKALLDLQNELDKMSLEYANNNKSAPKSSQKTNLNMDAYEQAKFLNAAYVNDPKFQMMFLRCHEFDITTTAETIIYHFQIKRELFGDGELLVRDISHKDLGERELLVLNCGAQQFLPKRDASGRIVQVMSGDASTDGVLEGAIFRAYWYTGMELLLQDEELQKNGYVGLCFNYTENKIDWNSFRELNKMEVAVPLRCAAFHYCYTSDKNRGFAAGIKMSYDADESSKMRLHHGTHEEICFKLQTFGIPVDVIPIQKNGCWHIEWHRQWVQALMAQEDERRRRLEPKQQPQPQEIYNNHNDLIHDKLETAPITPIDDEANASSNAVIIIPKKADVLFGKSPRARDHVGNIRAHYLVEQHFEEYEKANKVGKTRISNKIIELIQKEGGRFLKQQQAADKEESGNGTTWVQVTDTVARQKIAHWCRHLRSKTKSSSSTTTTEPTQQAVKRVLTPSPVVGDDDSDGILEREKTAKFV